MKFSALLPVVMAVFANQATAEPLRQPYKLNNARMSVRDIFGLQARQDGAYTPDQEFCGTGETCAEACGTGYKQCPSRDGNTHCFHAAAKQTCCFNQSGEACDEGFYCAADEKAATWCCPNELGLKDCAAKFNLPVLSTQTPSPTKTSSKATSTAKPTTTTAEKVETTSVATPSPTESVTATASTTTSPDEPSATVSITGKSSLVNVETSSTISSTLSSPSSSSSSSSSSSNLNSVTTTTTRIESATSTVESTNAQTISTITSSGTESAPAADCTTYTTALVVALTPSSIATTVTTVGTTPTSSVANSTVISPGTTTTAPPNPIKVSAANGRGAVCGTLVFGVAIAGLLF